jgi:hypothetical protein
MARVRVLTSPKRLTGPLTFWVHRPQGEEVWAKATRFDPPLPPAGPDGSFPHYVVEHLGHEVWFASLAEVRQAEEVLSRATLPSGAELAAEAGLPERGYMHWIETFPARLKAEDERRELVRLLGELRRKVEDGA